MQKVVEAHETDSSTVDPGGEAPAGGGVGSGNLDQVVPSHSASRAEVTFAPWEAPTAMQNELLTQEMPEN